ncbi:ATP-dependent helicase/nuclease subunit A [Gimesia panareensis]|uniref:DNA 3'-5' helicase n=1 Tax=Gimesia panareensis TaxID=2527978 RepID=A0A517Q7C1_9PLAN|nr:UvrD-helicase domain-containing protein [Gimesia panareensis]QDT27515.1 ATP-dependent helicase/nuclease subunit A [Gimesia panareensis]
MSNQPTYTEQQAAAINPRDVSIALSAGAGCGKTFVLTQRFLKLIEPGTPPDRLSHIVAITFTERAAREMRDRVRETCLEQLRSCAPDEVAHWQTVIRGLDSARISTIHSFCTSILRTHAVSARLDPHFGLLEQGTSDAFLRKVVREAVHDLLQEEDEDCLELVYRYGLERTYEMFISLVPQQFRIEFEQFAELTEEQLAGRMRSFWMGSFIPMELAEIANAESTRFLLRLMAAQDPVNKKMRERFQVLTARLPELLTGAEPNRAELLGTLIAHAKVQGAGTKKDWDDLEVYEQIKEGFSNLREKLTKVSKILSPDPAAFQQAAEYSLRVLRVTEFIANRYQESKAEKGLLDFDDLLLQTRDLFRRDPQARQRAAAGIEFLMVDEFQDTDPVQSEIVRALCGQDLLNGKLFLVGDAKQSIYRFRRADPEVFHQLRQEIPAEGRLPLSVNFRSQPAILNFTNCLFASAMEQYYEPLTPFDSEQHSPTPAIEFLFASPDEPEIKGAEALRETEAAWIAARVRQLLEDETPRIWAKNRQTGARELRRVEPGDICILFRALSNVALYEKALQQQDLDYYLVGGRAFYAQQEIYDLSNLCQYLDNADDELSLLGILRSPFFSLSDDTLYTIVRNADTLTRAMLLEPPGDLCPEQRRQVLYAQSVLQELRAKKDRLSLVELLNLALERTGYDAALLNEFLGDRKLANLRKLIELARNFEATGLFTLKDFVQRIRDSILEESKEELAATLPETSDVVRLMTIHQSKGLEFPVVILADMDRKPAPGATAPFLHPDWGALLNLPAERGITPDNYAFKMHRGLEQKADEEETVRLLYVAVTRAADYLILSAGLSYDRKIESPWMKLLARHFDLDTGVPAVDPYLGRLALGDIPPEQIPEIRVHHSLPQPATRPEKKQKELKPSQFVAALEQGTPEAFPESYGTIAPRPGALSHVSVSRLEVIDAQLQHSPDSAMEMFPSDDTLSAEEATQLGTLTHAVIERLEPDQPDQAPRIVNSVLADQTPQLVEKLQPVIERQIAAWYASDLCQTLKAAQTHYRELDFLLRWASGTDGNAEQAVTVTGTIDALVQTQSGDWMLFDYKTGSRMARMTAEQLIAEYEFQLGVYTLAVEQLLGARPASIGLAIVQDSVRYIECELDADRLEQISDRLSQAVSSLLPSPAAAESR